MIRPAVTMLLCLLLSSALAAGARVDFARSDEGEALLRWIGSEPDRAWGRLQELRGEHEGDPAFDVLLGRAALATGRTAEALLALERVEFIAPETPGLRPLLIAARMEQGERSVTARHDGSRVQAADPMQSMDVDREPLRELAAAVRAERFEEALRLAALLRDVWEGDPGFDYLYGLAALESGRQQEAVFALQRVLFFQPDQVQVRAHLARAHFLGGELDQAEGEFQAVLAASPPAEVSRSIRAYLAEVSRLRAQQRPSLAGFIELGVGYDDNVNSASSLETIATPIGTVPLSADGRSTKSGYSSTRGQLAYQHPLSRRRALDVVLAASLRDHFSAGQFDLDIYRAEAGYNISMEDHRLRAAVHVGHVRLDGSEFQWSGGISGSWITEVRDWELQAQARLSVIRFPDADSRDVDQFLLLLSASRLFERDLLSLDLLAGRDEARSSDGEHHGRDFASLAATWQHLLGDGHVPYMRLMLQGSRYHAPHPVFAERREEVMYAGSAGWNWIMSPALSARGELSYTRVDGTLDLFEYDRARVEAALRYRF
ncbi:MAG: tetratricopeptide repeat protein [Gammaproteobacteria bacterium]|nr:tetratricopeptide repeat protein [Gammaproteobacteria bacterium]